MGVSGGVLPAGPGPGGELVPAGFRLRPDPGARMLAGGTVLTGGLPAPGAAAQPGRGAARATAGGRGRPSPTAARPARWPGGCSTPGSPIPRSDDAPGGPGPDEVTVVIPVRDRAAELARCLAGLAGTAAGRGSSWSTTGPRTRPPSAGRAAAAGARVVRAPGERRARGGQEHRPGRRADAAGGVPRLGLRARPGLAGRAAAALRRPRGRRGRAAHRAARGRPHLAGAVRGGEFHPGHGRSGPASSGPDRACLTSPAPPWSSAGPPPGPVSPRTCRWGRTSTSSGGSARAGWRVRYEPAAVMGHQHRVRLRAVVRPAQGLRDVRGRARAAAPRHGPPALRVGLDRGGLAGRGARPPGGGRGWSPGPAPPCWPGGWRGSPASRGPARPARPPGGWRPGRPAAGRWRRPGRWAARCRGPGGRPRCRPRSRCGGCGSRWPRWSWRRRCSTGWTAGRRWTRRGTWPPGCWTTSRTAWGSGRDAPNGGPSSRCCPCYAAATGPAGP